MAREQLYAFSRITEQFLFFDVHGWQPKVRKSYAIKILVFILLTFKFVRFATTSNKDLAQHVEQGNFFVGFTLQSDLLTAPAATTVIEFATLMSYHVYLLLNRPQTLLSMTKVVGGCFQSMSERNQRLLIEITQFAMHTSRTLSLFIIGYAAYVALSTYDTTTWAKLQLIATSAMSIYGGQSAIMICYVIAVCMAMCCSLVINELKHAFQSSSDGEKLHNFNAVCARIHTLNAYWKYVSFLLVIGSAISTSVFLSATLLHQLPTIILVFYVLVVIAFSTMYSATVLLAARVHSRVKECHVKLLHLSNASRSVRYCMKLNHVLKKFEHLNVFTLADASPITFDFYREVTLCGRDAISLCLVRRWSPMCSLYSHWELNSHWTGKLYVGEGYRSSCSLNHTIAKFSI